MKNHCTLVAESAVVLLPKTLHLKMPKLLRFNVPLTTTFEDIIDLHCGFARIHSFQDGNSRVARLVIFKECLVHRIDPIVITEELELYYYRNLSE